MFFRSRDHSESDAERTCLPKNVSVSPALYVWQVRIVCGTLHAYMSTLSQKWFGFLYNCESEVPSNNGPDLKFSSRRFDGTQRDEGWVLNDYECHHVHVLFL